LSTIVSCGYQNAPADESSADGITEGLELLVPRSLVVAASGTDSD